MSSRPLAAMLSCSGLKLTDQEKKIFAAGNPLGIILFSRNISDKEQLKLLIRDIRETIGRQDVLIAVDQEGGRVRRLKEPQFRSYASQYDIGSMPKGQALRAAFLQACLISQDLREVGINVNFAPVLDICHPSTTEALKSRCFSSLAPVVSLLGKTMVDAYIASGILPCIKHLPGHGLAVSDPHLKLPIIDISPSQLATEIQPFQHCAAAPLGMTAHILLPQIDKNNPATQSPQIIKQIIREKIGFQGFLFSDSIDMKALQGSITEKVLTSLRAGCDCICYCMGKAPDLEALTSACPKLSDASMQRLDKALQILHNTPRSINQSDIEEYNTLIRNITPYQEKYDATEVLHQLQ